MKTKKLGATIALPNDAVWQVFVAMVGGAYSNPVATEINPTGLAWEAYKAVESFRNLEVPDGELSCPLDETPQKTKTK